MKTTLVTFLLLTLTLAAIGALPNDSILSAVREGDLARVQFYLVKGGDVEASERRGLNTLHILTIAVRSGHYDVAELLVAHGADMDRSFHAGSPLFCAIQRGDREMVEYLVAADADIERGILKGAIFGLRNWMNIEIDRY